MPIMPLRYRETFEPNIDPPESRENERISSLAQELLQSRPEQELLEEQEKYRLEPERIELFEEDSPVCGDSFCILVLAVMFVYLSYMFLYLFLPEEERNLDFWEIFL